MQFNTKLSITEYVALVNYLAVNAFDVNGNYIPHGMRLAAMMEFYDLCTDRPYEIDNPNSPESYEEVFDDDEFLNGFSKEIKNSANANKLTFNQAYHDAKEICEYKNKNAERALANLVNHISASCKDITGMLTDENVANLEKVIELFRKIGAGEDITQDDVHIFKA